MPESQTARSSESIIVRKLAKIETGGQDKSLPVDLFNDLCLLIEKTRRPLFHARIRARVERQETLPFSDVLAGLTEPAPIAIHSIDGPDRPALIAVDPALAFHATDLMLGGDAGDAPALMTRPFTVIDNVVLGQMIDALATDFLSCLSAARPGAKIEGIRRLSLEHETAMARVVPATSRTLVVRLTLLLGEAGREGSVAFVLPATTLDALGGVSATPATTDPWALKMRAATLEMEIEAVAAACRTQMTVAELSRLDIGQVLPLPAEALGDVALLVETEDGTADIARGRLGAHQGHKAIKLHEQPDTHFLAPMRALIDGTG